MKINLKTLHKHTFVIEVEPTETILNLKEKILIAEGYPVELQKIIYSGKILVDETTVLDAGLKEGKEFCVVMVSKPKATPAPALIPVTPAPAQVAAPVAPNAPGPSTTVPDTPAATTTEETLGDNNESFLRGSALETSVTEMIAMGFPREQVMRAMKAAYNNPHRAVEFLFSGIPESAAQEARAAPPPTNATVPETPTPSSVRPSPAVAAPATTDPVPRNLFEAAARQASAPAATAPTPAAAAGTTPGAAGGGLSMIRNTPIFAQLRTLVQQNPALLQPFLAQLGQSNPQLLQHIDNNQAEFIEFLQDGLTNSDSLDDELMDQFGDLNQPTGDFSTTSGGVSAGDGSQEIRVTPEEGEAIDRLIGMGFERDLVIQSYFACDKNEELTANYLIEHGMGDDDFQD